MDSKLRFAAITLGVCGISACVTSTAEQQANCTGVELPVERLLLQQVSPTSAVIKWRGEADEICVGPQKDRLNTRVAATDEGHHKFALVTGLNPDTEYFYSIGAASVGAEGYRFKTAPSVGELSSDGNTHIWILGDSGTAGLRDENGDLAHKGAALAVKDGYFKYRQTNNVEEPLDLLLLLGDNAYLSGADAEWQESFFEVYPEIINSTLVVPTIGNHEMGVGEFNICPFRPVEGCENGPVRMAIGGASYSSDPASYDSDGDGPDPEGFPYMNIFSLPTKGELGGVPSGTEQYYSLDYGNVHIVSLDSQLANVDENARMAMRDWLIDDLDANQLDWTVVIFHHPPYSKGENHDSDLEQREIDMRQTFAPVFEDYGVDVVYSGHSHSYERSWYLHGHYGKSDTFDMKEHTEHDGNGKAEFGFADKPYKQISNVSGADDKAIYTVAGSSGMVNHYDPCPEGRLLGCTKDDWLQHPAHRTFEADGEDYRPHGVAKLGSVVLDATSTSLTSKFIDSEGQVLDHFVIQK